MIDYLTDNAYLQILPQAKDLIAALWPQLVYVGLGAYIVHSTIRTIIGR